MYSRQVSLRYSDSDSCLLKRPVYVHYGCATGQTYGRFRIEGGNEGTVFENCLASGPEEATAPSGDTHECDGTDDGCNPSPGATCTTQIQQAAAINGFGFDGTLRYTVLGPFSSLPQPDGAD